MFLVTLDRRLVNLAHFAMVYYKMGPDGMTLYAWRPKHREAIEEYAVLFVGSETDCQDIVTHIGRAARANQGAISLADIPLSVHMEKGQPNGESS